MNKLPARWILIFVVSTLFILTIVACRPGEETAEPIEPEEAVVETAVLPTATSALILSPTVLPTETATAMPIPIITATPIVTANPTATMTPVPRLTNSQPTLADLQEYLANVPVRFFSEQHNGTLPYEGYFQEFPLSENAEIVYQDVNGNGVDDIILHELQPFPWGRGILLVMTWQADGYGDPLLLVGFAKYDPRHRFFFEDWTGDGILEMVYDFMSDNGGTGYIEITQTRYLIHCQQTCKVAWWKVTGMWEQYYTVGWTHTAIERFIDDETLNLSVLTESFYAPQLQDIHLDKYNPGFQVLTSTLEIYAWNETRFELVESQILSPAYYSESQPTWTAVNTTGLEAHLVAEFSDEDTYLPIYACTVHIEEVWVSEPFDCDPGFTSVAWRDITGDGQDEIVITTLAFRQQRLLAFQWNGVETVPIADVSGDIIRSNLFGVALEDVNGDGRMEIRAAKIDLSQRSFCRYYSGFYPDEVEICWVEWIFVEDVYKWNGVAYIKRD
jgi:hypothetical protein